MCRGLALAFAFAVLVSSSAASSDSYDIREDPHKADVIDRHRAKAGPRNEKIKDKKEKMRAAHDRVKGDVPGLDVALNAQTGAAEIVGIARGRQKLTAKSREPREHVARGFLQRNADLYGLSAREVAQLRKSADYANPSGNIAWVEFHQEINGLPVFQGEIRFAVTAEGELVQSSGNLVPGLEEFDAAQEINVDAKAAIVVAAESIGVALTPVMKEPNVFDRGPFTDDVKTRLEWFPLDSGVVTLAWSMILWQEHAAHYVYVSAEDGELLWRKNLAVEQSQPATYVVYDADSPAPLSPSHALPGSGIQAPPIARTAFTVISEGAFNNLGWMTDGTSITTGNNVDAGLDLAAPDGIDAGTRPTGTAFRIFDYPYNPPPGNPAPGDEPSLANYRFGEVVHMFFWANRYHDRLYELGFTEAARNFQQDNFGRGGAGNDPIVVEGQDYSTTNNAAFVSAPDGTSGKVQMFLFTGPAPDRSSGLDQDILLHELAHGTSLRLHANTTGLLQTMAGGMGEGWSDFYARVLTSGPDEDVNGVYPAGAYVALLRFPGATDNYYYGARRFPYAVISSLGPNGRPHNPLTFADIDPLQVNLTDGAYPRGPGGSTDPFEVHNIGEVWCSMLLEVRARLINRLGWAAGNQLALQLVTDGMKLDPFNPTLLQGRNAILAANFASTSASAATEVDIWRGFAARGLGFSASVIAGNNSSVVEAFDVPNVIIGNATIVSDDCNHNGVADPGETVVLSIAFTNPYQLNDVNDAIVTVGGTTATLGPLAPGQTVVRTFTIVPPVDSCGMRLDMPISVSTSLGNAVRPFTLPIGVATAQVLAGTFSSGNVASPILDDQTTEVSIVVPESGPVGGMAVYVRLNHTNAGDLAISLVGPDGTTVQLANRRGGSGDNFGSGSNDCSGTPAIIADFGGTSIAAGTAPFVGEPYRPETPLTAFSGREMNGTWKLRITDHAAGNTGTLGCVKLDLGRQYSYCCGIEGPPVILAAPPATLVSECTSNAAPDPGEIVTMNFPLVNRGAGLTTDLVATLVAGGGVTPLSGSQSYGALSPIGSAAARPFTFAIADAIACGADAIATFAVSDAGEDLGTVSFNVRTGALVTTTQTFANPAPIAIPVGGAASPYPSSIAVSGVAGTVTNMSLTLHGFSHTGPADVDLLLVGPGGQKFIPMSDVGTFPASNLTMTLDSTAAAALSSFLSSGTFRPTNSITGDTFPPPAPPAPYSSPSPAGGATFLSVFGASSPNGTWSLYAVDDAGPVRSGSIAAGWSLTFRTTAPQCDTIPPPVITAAGIDQTELWPPDHRMRDVTVAYESTCASCSLSVTSNEPDDAGAIEIVDAHHVRLRAARFGTGTGRVYTITIACANGSGVATQSFEVVVPHDLR